MKLTKSTTLPPNEDDRIGSTAQEKEQQACQVKKNILAMANFKMAFKSETFMSIIYKSQSTSWPTGETHVISSHLLEKYQHLDMVASIEMQQALPQLKKNDDENLELLFNKMCCIENQY